MRLYKRIPHNDEEKVLAMPRALSLMKKCVQHKIQPEMIARLHFNDLYVLIMSMDIAKIKEYLAVKEQQENQKRGYSVKKLTPEEAYNELMGG